MGLVLWSIFDNLCVEQNVLEHFGGCFVICEPLIYWSSYKAVLCGLIELKA